MSTFIKCLIAVFIGAVTGVLRYFFITKKKENKKCQKKKENAEGLQQATEQKQ